jgi:hypothetical protein
MKPQHLCFRASTGKALGLLCAAAALLAASGCASTRSVPLAIHSDPAGAFVVMQVKDEDQRASDWVYLGNTPLLAVREMPTKEIEDASEVVLKVMKEGYIDQAKSWKGEAFLKEESEKERIYWNPRLVPVR